MAAVRPIAARDEARWRELFTAYGVFYKTAFGPEVLDGVWRWLLDPDHEVNAFVAVAESVAESDAAANAGTGAGADPIIGFAHFRQLADTFTAGHSLYLDDLYVDPAARGTGAATALLEAMAVLSRERGCTEIRWITAADNARAQRVYDRLAKKTSWVTYEMDV